MAKAGNIPGTYTIDETAVPGQLPGTNTNNNATAGNVGEYIKSEVAAASAVSLTTAETINITSISLTAGDWDITGNVWWGGTATTAITQLLAGISTISGNLPQDSEGMVCLVFPSETPFSVNNVGLSTGTMRLSLSTTTTVYLETFTQFTLSTLKAYGIIKARRVR